MRIAVVGLGSIGGIVAGCLIAAGRHSVVACVRRPFDRLGVERPEGDVEVSLHALHDFADAEPVDWVLLCTKTHETASTAPWLARLCGPSTRVAVLQNGIHHDVRVGPLVGEARIVSAIVYFNGERLAPDRVRLRHAGDYDLAVADDDGGRAFAQLLEGTPLRTLLSSDFATLAWRKLLMNVSVNPITALTLQRQGVLRRDDVQALCSAILEEAVSVGRRDGARFSDDEAARTISILLTYPPDAGTSMYFDRLAGRKLEVDSLTGAIVAAGERHGIATPLNRAMLTLLRAISDAAPSDG